MFGVNLDFFYFAHVAFGKYRSINMIYYLLLVVKGWCCFNKSLKHFKGFKKNYSVLGLKIASNKTEQILIAR